MKECVEMHAGDLEAGTFLREVSLLTGTPRSASEVQAKFSRLSDRLLGSLRKFFGI